MLTNCAGMRLEVLIWNLALRMRQLFCFQKMIPKVKSRRFNSEDSGCCNPWICVPDAIKFYDGVIEGHTGALLAYPIWPATVPLLLRPIKSFLSIRYLLLEILADAKGLDYTRCHWRSGVRSFNAYEKTMWKIILNG